jgi:RecA-family ATPase
MLSWIEYGNREVDRTSYHIGEGFLEIGCFVMLIGASYVGKSTFLAQLTINFAIGRNWLFFKVEKKLRIMIVQAEDPENKLIKMGQMAKKMSLSPGQMEIVDKNTAVLTINDLQDAPSLAEIERHANVYKPDIICINPLTSYLSGGVYKEETINEFLRVKLTPMLFRLQCSAIVVHHPPKPMPHGDVAKKLTAFELQYGGAGMAALTNAPRGNLFLTHVDGDIFKLATGKGFDDLGCEQTSAYLQRCKPEGIMHWKECTEEQAEKATEAENKRKAATHGKNGNGPNGFISYEKLLKYLDPVRKYTPEQMIEISKKNTGKGKNWTEDAMKALVFEKKLLRSSIKNPRGGPFSLYHLPTKMEQEGQTEGDDVPV